MSAVCVCDASSESQYWLRYDAKELRIDYSSIQLCCEDFCREWKQFSGVKDLDEGIKKADCVYKRFLLDRNNTLGKSANSF